jgi:hypothetical protein
METHENRLNEEPRLCVVRRFEGLIEWATWVKNGRKGSVLVVGLRLHGPDGQCRRIHDVFSENALDQNRLKGLCEAIGVGHRKLCLDDLVARKVEVAENAQRSKNGQIMAFSYFPPEKRHLRQNHGAM